MIPRNFPNHNNDRKKIIPKISEKCSFQYFKKHQTLFNNLLYKFTGRNDHRVDEQITYPTKKKKEAKLHISATKNDRYPKVCVVVDSKSMNPTRKEMKRKFVEYTNVDSNTILSKSPQTVLVNTSSLSENIGCLNKLNRRKTKRLDIKIQSSSKPNGPSNHSNVHVKNNRNIENFNDSYVLSNYQSKCLNYLKSLKYKKNSKKSLEYFDNEQKNNFCSKAESNYNAIDKRNSTRKTVKKENKSEKYLFPDSTANHLSSHLNANLILKSKYEIIKKQKPIIKSKPKTKKNSNKHTSKSIQMKSDRMIKRKNIKRIGSKSNQSNWKFRRIKEKKFTNNSLKMNNFELKYSYRILLHQKPYYIIDDLINYSFYLHYSLTVFDKLRIEFANIKVNIGFDFQSISNCVINSQSIETSIQMISPFQVEIFNVYHSRSISKIEKLKIFINKMDHEFVECITEFTKSDFNQTLNVQKHFTDTYFILSKSNFNELDIYDKNSICGNYSVEDSWDEISPTNSNTSCTIATKENKSIGSDDLYKTEDIYCSDIEMDTIPEMFTDENLDDNSRIDQLRSEEYSQMNNYQLMNIDQNQLIDLSRSVENFTVKHGDLLILFEMLNENQTSLHNCQIIEIQILILHPIVYVFQIKNEVSIFMFDIESCETFNSDEITSQCFIKVEEKFLKLMFLPIINYSNIHKEQSSNMLSSTNESSFRCWEIINEDDYNNRNVIDLRKIVNQLKLLMISEISISIDKTINNFHNIIFNNHRELFTDSSNNINYRCYY